MICTPSGRGWRVVYQNAHARVAADLLRPLRADLRADPAGGADRWDELLFATAQHDNGWQEWEPGDWRLPSGAPRPFDQATMADVVAQSGRTLGRVRHASLFAALLVAEHFRSLYGRLPDAGVREMLRAQTPLRARWRRALGATQADVDRHYAYLRWADTFSLLLCEGFPTGGVRVDVGPLGPLEALHAEECPGEAVALDPWPYSVPEVVVRAEAYALPKLSYASDAALARALARAAPAPLVWSLAPAGRASAGAR